MKTKKLFLGLLTLTVLAATTALFLMPNSQSDLSDTTVKHQKKKKDAKGIAGAIEYYHRLQADVVSGEIDLDKIKAAKQAVKGLPSSKAFGLTWEELGPNNVGGRVRALIFDNQDNTNNTMYAGGVQGGLWISLNAGATWAQVPLAGNIAISSMCQTPNGDIFVGTGEGLAQAMYTNRNSGSLGEGIYLQAAGTTGFSIIANTTSWTQVNRLASDKNGKVYAATSVGLKSTTDNGATAWKSEKIGSFKDVKCVPNETMVAATNGKKVWISPTGLDDSWVLSTPNSAGSRVEVAIAPSNKNVIYAVVANGSGELAGIYKTIDAGGNWALIGQGGSSAFNLFRGQGGYNNVAMVHKTNPDKIYVGGIDLWIGQEIAVGSPYSWTKKSNWYSEVTSDIYVHADQHVYTQHPTDPNTFYQGTDGGVSKTNDGATTFNTLNTNFNVTQFYAVSAHPNGGVLGGTQDNGTQFIDATATHPDQLMQAREINGGDGGFCAASMLNQEVLFATIYGGEASRSSDFGYEMQPPSDPNESDIEKNAEFYSKEVNTNLSGAFVTPVAIWETIKFPNSRDTVNYVADQDYVAGDTVDGRSATNNAYPFQYILPANISFSDTIKIADPVQSRFFVGTAAGIWMTKESLYFVNKTPEWSLVSKNTAGGAIWLIQVSNAGDHLYYGLNNSQLGRLSNLLDAQEDSTADANSSDYVIHDTIIKSFAGAISSISIDPDDADNVVVTIGGTSSNSIYYSTNATSANPTFTSKVGNLPANTPVYASLIPLGKSNSLIIGTEFGIFSTENLSSGNPTWTKEDNGGMNMIPVYQLYQMQRRLAWRKTVTLDQGNPLVQIYPGVYNHGQIYAATHGRGFFTCKTFMSIDDKHYDKVKYIAGVKLYPNPTVNSATVEFDLNKSVEVSASIYDINGRMINNMNFGKINGKQIKSINTSDLATGMYILQVKAGTETNTTKFIKK